MGSRTARRATLIRFQYFVTQPLTGQMGQSCFMGASMVNRTSISLLNCISARQCSIRVRTPRQMLDVLSRQQRQLERLIAQADVLRPVLMGRLKQRRNGKKLLREDRNKLKPEKRRTIRNKSSREQQRNGLVRERRKNPKKTKPERMLENPKRRRQKQGSVRLRPSEPKRN